MFKNPYFLTFLNIVIFSGYIFVGIPRGDFITLLIVSSLLVSHLNGFRKNWNVYTRYTQIMSFIFTVLVVTYIFATLFSFF